VVENYMGKILELEIKFLVSGKIMGKKIKLGT
jgi:hypothetical protein